jgi:superfamily II RNA helicase
MKAGLASGLVIPDLWQQEAIRALQQGKDVVVQAPTGSGKTYIFELFYPDLKGQAVFTVPTRALANDKLAEWRARGWDVGISTGDVAANLDARVVVATLETQRGRLSRSLSVIRSCCFSVAAWQTRRTLWRGCNASSATPY